MDYLIRIILKYGLTLHTKTIKKRKATSRHILALMIYKCMAFKKISINGQILLMKLLIIGFVKDKNVQATILHSFN